MCGIAALISLEGEQDLRGIAAMLSTVQHRGPDDEGAVVFSRAGAIDVYGGPATPPCCWGQARPYLPAARIPATGLLPGMAALGHRRLAIVDPSAAGHQPMTTPDRRLWIVFNGEIYNHRELRDELRAGGYQFQSRSDTEVLLAAYQRWGPDCLHKLNGMFSLVLFDVETSTVIAARDRFGIKPLYYWISPNGVLAFASEIKQFIDLPGWRASVNGQAAYDFLCWGLADHTDETLFHGVFQLRPGSRVVIDLEHAGCLRTGTRLEPASWYTLRPARRRAGFDAAVRRFGELFEDSVRLRMPADVSFGSCLSGGLDSSSIVCTTSQLLRDSSAGLQPRTFSAYSDVEAYDERQYAEEVIRHTRVQAYSTIPSLNQLFDLLPDLTWHNDEPFGSTSIYAQWQVFALAAREGVKVMLDGQGADEHLAGYHSFYGPRFAGLLEELRLIALSQEIAAATSTYGYPLSWAARLLADGLLPHPIRNTVRRIGRRTHLRPDWIDSGRLGATPGDPFVLFGDRRARSVREASIAQLTRSSLQMLLHWADRDSMAHSIETRLPFLDHRLAELVVSLPDEYKLYRGETKRVLRSAMRGILPEAVRTRSDKVGFATPEEVWVREHGADMFRNKVSQAVDQSKGILTSKAPTFLEDVISGVRPFSSTPWRMISFGAWMDRFAVNA